MVINHILVDASIAKSAADPARHEVSLACLEFSRVLEDRSCKTGVAMTPQLEDEWRRHASRYMTSWLVSMETRKRVRHIRDRRVRDFRMVVAGIEDDGIRAAILKDSHLSEAALSYAIPVASRDDRQRRYLSCLVADYPLAGAIQWLNPEKPQGSWRHWIVEGCVERGEFSCALPGAALDLK